MTSLMALTLHYLTEDFQMREFTLEASPVQGNHTADMIRESLISAFQKWGLNEGKLSLMLRDSASPGVKACNDWGIEHASCINHLLHLLVGPFLVPKRKKKDSSDNDGDLDDDVHDCTADGVDDVFDDDDDAWNDDEMMDEIRLVVDDFCKATKFLRTSIKCKELLEKVQSLQQVERILSVHLDVRTRWNSTYLMLRRMLKLQTIITQFQVYYKSAEGKRNFRSSKTKFPDLTEEKWAIIHGLCYLFAAFDKATKYLGGQKYPTFVSALPCLRTIKQHLDNDRMFDNAYEVSSNKKFKSKFQNRYGESPFFESVLAKLESCQKKLLEGFKRRFSGMNFKILWTSLFDPRYAPASHLTEVESTKATASMKQELQNVIVPFLQLPGSSNTAADDTIVLTVLRDDDESSEFDEVSSEAAFVSPQTATAGAQDSPASKLKRYRQQKKSNINDEVDNYLYHLSKADIKAIKCPLEWWAKHRLKYPNVAVGARKWLSVCATSTPSERVFSISGLIDTPKRSNLTGEAIYKQILIHNNWKSLNPSLERLGKVLK